MCLSVSYCLYFYIPYIFSIEQILGTCVSVFLTVYISIFPIFSLLNRSWVHVSQCFLLSKEIPATLQKGRKNAGLDGALEELNLHIQKIK